jgi:hemerythrin-like domain-containing protein
MAADRSMNVIIHGAFRRDFERFENALATFPDGSKARAQQLGQAWDFLSHELHEHHDGEETIFFPAVQELGADTELLTALRGEHERMVAALATASTAMSELTDDPTGTKASAARAAIGHLREVFESHIAHEERQLEPLLMRDLHAPPLKRAAKQVQRSRPPAEGARFIAWLRDGGTPENQAALKATIPAPVLFLLSRVIGRGYRRVAAVWS